MSESDPVAASETPLTDANARMVVAETPFPLGALAMEPYEAVSADFARSLELRLTAAPTEMTRLNNAHFAEQWDRLTAILGDERRSVMDTVSEVERRLTQAGRAVPVAWIVRKEFDEIYQHESGARSYAEIIGAQVIPLYASTAPAAPAVETCPLCKGVGKVDVGSFVDSSKSILHTCRVCKGTGNLPAVAPDSGGEREAALREYIDGLFVSGNEVPVTRAYLNADSWNVIKDCLAEGTPLVHHIIEAEVAYQHMKATRALDGKETERTSPLAKHRAALRAAGKDAKP